jgi:hypothetical protein
MSELTIDEVTTRVAWQRGIRETSLREPDPEPNPIVQREIERREKTISTFEFECQCGCPISTRSRTGACPSCGTQFDLTRWP